MRRRRRPTTTVRPHGRRTPGRRTGPWPSPGLKTAVRRSPVAGRNRDGAPRLAGRRRSGAALRPASCRRGSGCASVGAAARGGRRRVLAGWRDRVRLTNDDEWGAGRLGCGDARRTSDGVPTPTSLPAGDGEGSPAGGIGCVRRRALRGGPALRAASMTGGRSTASGCRRRGAAGAGGAPRRLRGRGTHATIVGVRIQPTRRELLLRAQGHTRRRGAGGPVVNVRLTSRCVSRVQPGGGHPQGVWAGRRRRGDSRQVFEPETRIP